jgi:hypothetical protein
MQLKKNALSSLSNAAIYFGGADREFECATQWGAGDRDHHSESDTICSLSCMQAKTRLHYTDLINCKSTFD